MDSKTCTIEYCDNEVLARGWCRKHYYRWKRAGDPTKTARYMDHREALRNYPKRRGDCLIWTGPVTEKGYGIIHINGNALSVHRYIWEQKRGPIPDGLELDHRCHNRACIELSHLRIATHAENTANKAGPRSDNKSSGIRNVYPSRNGWYVAIQKDGVGHYFGLYSDKHEAAAVAEEKRKEIFGEYAGKG